METNTENKSVQDNSFMLPKNFLLGVATAATQIEGGDTNNSWYEWAKAGHIKDGSSPFRADDHYNRVESDTSLMSSMKIQIYRLGIEWSRIEVSPGLFNDEAVNHYIEEIKLLKSKNIQPLVTLHHFTNPTWFENMGGFENDDSVEIFLRFVRYIVPKLGEFVSEWITINEPNVYTIHGYFYGMWPPGKKSFSSVRHVYKNLSACHILSYLEIHKIAREKGFENVKVGFANHLHTFKPLHTWNPIHIFCSWFINRGFQYAVTDACMTGKFGFFVKKSHNISRGRYYDFAGINYYTRDAVGYMTTSAFPNTQKNDLGWEIRPKGISEFSRYIFNRYQAPIYITENGIADKEDVFRAKYIYSHLYELVTSGVPVERYYYWTFMDNFEWVEGESACFGLVAVNYETQERNIRRSGEFFTKIIENSGVTNEMYDEYIR